MENEVLSGEGVIKLRFSRLRRTWRWKDWHVLWPGGERTWPIKELHEVPLE